MKFHDLHKERLVRTKLDGGTLMNYYRTAKLFCEMNELTLNWKRIVRGLPRAEFIAYVNSDMIAKNIVFTI